MTEPPRLVVVYAPALGRAKPLLGEGAEWCFLGTDSRTRERIGLTCGEDARFDLEDRLHQVAEDLRQPFLDFVAALGRIQVDRPTWMASRFASRSPYQDHFFLLLCFKALVHRLAGEASAWRAPRCVILQDPWLFEDLRGELADHPATRFVGRGRGGMIRDRCRWVLRGVAMRVMQGGHLLAGRLLTWLAWSRVRRDGGAQPRDTVWLLSFPEERAFREDGTFADPYLGDLEGILQDGGLPVRRLFSLGHPLRFVRPTARLESRGWSLNLEMRLHDLLELRRTWVPRVFPDPAAMKVDEFSTTALLERERWEEFSSPAFVRYLVFYRASKRFFASGRCRSLVYFFENQPVEKILCLAAEGVDGLRLVGYQHSTLPRFLLMHFLGRGEAEWLPLPSLIVANGAFWAERLRDGGYPDAMIRIGGTLRYGHLLDHTSDGALPRERKTGGMQDVALVLPVDPNLAATLVRGVLRALRGLDTSVTPPRVRVRLHPDTDRARLRLSVDEQASMQWDRSPLVELLGSADLVIYHGSTVGLEALLSGKPTLSVLFDDALDLDPLAGADVDGLTRCRVGRLADTLAEILADSASNPQRAGHELHDVGRFFSPVAPDVWLDAVAP